MAATKLKCPSCGALLVDRHPEAVGTVGNCPRCRKSIFLPASRRRPPLPEETPWDADFPPLDASSATLPPTPNQSLTTPTPSDQPTIQGTKGHPPADADQSRSPFDSEADLNWLSTLENESPSMPQLTPAPKRRPSTGLRPSPLKNSGPNQALASPPAGKELTPSPKKRGAPSLPAALESGADTSASVSTDGPADALLADDSVSTATKPEVWYGDDQSSEPTSAADQLQSSRRTVPSLTLYEPEQAVVVATSGLQPKSQPSEAKRRSVAEIRKSMGEKVAPAVMRQLQKPMVIWGSLGSAGLLILVLGTYVALTDSPPPNASGHEKPHESRPITLRPLPPDPIGGSVPVCGFVAAPQGFILTTKQIAFVGTDRLLVRLAGVKDPAPATVVYADKDTDVALLQIPVPAGVTLKPLAFETEHGTQRDDQIRAWYNPAGQIKALEPQLLKGFVTALPASSNGNMIHLSEEIASGSCGSPVCNEYGNVLGMATNIPTGRASYEKLGFAVASSRLLEILAIGMKGYKPASPGAAKVGLDQVDRLVSPSLALVYRAPPEIVKPQPKAPPKK